MIAEPSSSTPVCGLPTGDNGEPPALVISFRLARGLW